MNSNSVLIVGEDLNNQGERMKHSMGGAACKRKRFCVLVPKSP